MSLDALLLGHSDNLSRAYSTKKAALHHHEVGSSASDYPTCPEDHYRQIYSEALDSIVEAIKDRFDQPQYQV